MTEQERKTQTIKWIVTGLLMLLGLYNNIALYKGWAHLEIGDEQLTEYVTWFYEFIVGAYGWYVNNNVTEDAQVSQLVLNALKSNSITPAQVENLLNNPVVQKVAAGTNVSEDQLMMFLFDKDLQDVAQAQVDNKDVEVMIDD